MRSTRPAVIDTAYASAEAAVAAAAKCPSTPSPISRDKRSGNKKRRTGTAGGMPLETKSDDENNDDVQQQQPLSTPTSIKRKPDITPHGSSNSKRTRRSAAVSFSPHLSIVHEFESNSPSKRRLDYRSGSAAILDDDQVRMELDVQGHKLSHTEPINAKHRALVDQMHARDLFQELKLAGLEPQQNKTLDIKSNAVSTGETMCTPHSTSSSTAGSVVPVLAITAVTDLNRTFDVANSVPVAGTSKEVNNKESTRKSKRKQLSAAKENFTSLHSFTSTSASSSSSSSSSDNNIKNKNNNDKDATDADDEMKHSIEELRTRVKCARWIIRRAHLRLAYGADTPVNMAERRLERELERRKIAQECINRNNVKPGGEVGVSTTARERSVAALEMAMEHEQAGLVGMGYDFGKRHVSIDELCEMEGPSTEKELRLFLVDHKVKTVPRSRKARVALYRELLEQELRQGLDRALGLELVDELARRGLEKPILRKPFSKSSMQRHLNRMMLDMLLKNMEHSGAVAKVLE